MMRAVGLRSARRALYSAVLAAFGLLLVLSGVAHGQSEVLAEAINQANLRAGPGIDYDKVGEIRSGTKYPVIGRSARFPWYLLQLPTGQQGWVFKDLVMITGDINSVPVTEATVVPVEVLPPTLTPEATLIQIEPLPTDGTAALSDRPVTATPDLIATIIVVTSAPTAELPGTPAPSPTPLAVVYAEAIESANLRYGPSQEYPRIGQIRKGEKYAVLQRHSQANWIEIAYAGVASGRAWVYRDLVNLEGDLNSVPITNRIDFGYPTLTPTAAMVVAGAPPWAGPGLGAGGEAGLPAGLETLSNAIYDYLLAQDFVPRTEKQGSAFLLDLQSGQSFSLNPNIAYSGVSVIKVPVLVAFFRKVDRLPTEREAQLMSEMVICSENLSSNALLKTIGDGDEYQGALYVTETMQLLGLKNTFLVRSFYTGVTPVGPTPTEQPFVPVPIEADQTQTQPDPSNQTTPEDMGWLLGAIYQCARDGSGPLTETFPGEMDLTKCRRMLRVLRANRIEAMLEAGVPDNVIVAHKHGWAGDTHGDTGIIFTPGGDYVLSIMLYNRTWLLQTDSFPVFAEISRQVYNAYNPTQPLAQTNTQPVPFCSIDAIRASDPLLLEDLQRPALQTFP